MTVSKNTGGQLPPSSDASWAFAWNAPRPAVDPADFGHECPKPTALARMIACYREDERRARAAFEVEEDEPDDLPDLPPTSPRAAKVNRAMERERERDEKLKKTKEERQAARHDRDANAVAALMALPDYLRSPLLQRLRYLRRKQQAAEQTGGTARPASRFLHSTLNRIFKRLALIDDRYLTRGYQYVAARERLDELLRLPQLNKREVQLVATLTAGAIDGLFTSLCARRGDNYTLDDALDIYQQLARMALRLNVTPPAWDTLRTDIDRRTEPNLDRLPGAIARLTCAAWWQRKLWRQRRLVAAQTVAAAPHLARGATARRRPGFTGHLGLSQPRRSDRVPRAAPPTA